MPTTITRRPRLGTALAVLALGTFSVAGGSAAAAIYRCEEPGGGVLYADYPCKGGTVVDIRPGSAAPDATERLQRARDELDRAAARREANEALAALRREQLYQSSRLADPESMPPPADVSYGIPYGFSGPYGYGPVGRDRTHRPDKTDHGRGDRSRARQGRLPAAIAPPTRSAVMRR